MGDANQAPGNSAPELPPDDGKYELNDFGETVMYLSQPEETEQSPLAEGDSKSDPAGGGADSASKSDPASQSDPADSSKSNTPALPAQIDKYEIQGLLGRGAYGAVYLGLDSQLERQVAVKVALLNSDQKSEELLVSEARQLAKLTHPNIVTIFDVGLEQGKCFIVADYLNGRDLNQWMSERTPTWRESALMIAAIADGLAEAHAQNTIHRDIKPANIIVMERAEGPTPVLVDFGLALSSPTGGRRGEIVGTPNYMSPEQAQGEGHRIDGRTDIYALGVILYKMLAGELPFRAPKITELLRMIVNEEPRPPRQFVHGIPAELERICLKAMAKSFTDRYTTAGDMARELRELVRETEAASAKPAVKAKPKPNVPKSGIRMLIAEDHELTRFKLQKDLEKWGHEVIAAVDGEEAFELFQKEKFSIVITDWMMPNMDGLQLVQKIRALKKDEYVYVIMLTAKAEKHDIVVGMGAGADDFLAKPFHRDELNVRVRAGVRITKLNQQLTETNRRFAHTLQAATRMQQSCLPTSVPDTPGFDIMWDYQPFDLGGDVLNIVPLDDRQIGLYVLDVNAHGVPASLLATSIGRVMSPSLDSNSVLVEHDGTSTPRVLEPFEVASQLNEQFAWAGREGQFFSLIYGVLDTHSHEFRYTSAGHPPLIHHSANAAPEVVGMSGMPIGMTTDCDYEQDSLTLEPGDRLLLYSNGLTDMPNESDELFGVSRVLKSLERLGRLSLNESVRGLLSDLGKWRGQIAATDDVSVLAVEVATGR